MKRKIIRLGASTQVISLPKSWASRFGLNQGDELNIQERGRHLTIATEKDIALEHLSLDITYLPPLVNFGLLSIYLRGVDEVEVLSEKPDLIGKLQEKPISQLIGFEIVEQSKNRALIKDVSGTKDVDFSNLTRRIFLLLLSLSEELLAALKKRETNLAHVTSIDLNINRFSFLCLRVLNKRGADDYRKTPAMYALVLGLEAIGDEYTDLTEYVMKNKTKFDATSLAFLERTNQLLRDFYTLFFQFDATKAGALDARYRRLKSDLENTKVKSQELRLIFYSEKIADRIAEMNRNYLTIAL